MEVPFLQDWKLTFSDFIVLKMPINLELVSFTGGSLQ